MNKKCLFDKSEEHCNTAITLESKLGPVTVYVSDNHLHKTLVEVKEAFEALLTQAQDLADTFGFDLEEAINKGGIMKIGSATTDPLPKNTSPLVSSASQGMRQQAIPPKASSPSEGSEKPSGDVAILGSPIYNPEAPMVDSIEEARQLENNKSTHRVTTPNGRTFDVPDGIMINTLDSEKEFNARMKRDAQKTLEGNPTSYSNYRTRKCPMCKGNGFMSDKSVCQKCKGEAILHVV